jgi:hypothetical protein
MDAAHDQKADPWLTHAVMKHHGLSREKISRPTPTTTRGQCLPRKTGLRTDSRRICRMRGEHTFLSPQGAEGRRKIPAKELVGASQSAGKRAECIPPCAVPAHPHILQPRTPRSCIFTVGFGFFYMHPRPFKRGVNMFRSTDATLLL